MGKPLLFWYPNHRLQIVVVPWILGKCVSIGKNVVLAGPDDLAINCCLAAAFASNDKRLPVCNSFAVGLVILKCLFEEVITVGISATEVLNVYECAHGGFQYLLCEKYLPRAECAAFLRAATACHDEKGTFASNQLAGMAVSIPTRDGLPRRKCSLCTAGTRWVSANAPTQDGASQAAALSPGTTGMQHELGTPLNLENYITY